HGVARELDGAVHARLALQNAVDGVGGARRDLVLPGFAEQGRTQREMLSTAHRISMHDEMNASARIAARIRGTAFLPRDLRGRRARLGLSLAHGSLAFIPCSRMSSEQPGARSRMAAEQ